MPIRATIIAVACLACSQLQAQEGNRDGQIEVACAAGNENSMHFPQLQNAARELNQKACFALLGSDTTDFKADQNALYRAFGTMAKKTAGEKLSDPPFNDVEKPFTYFIATISEKDFSQKSLPEFRVDPAPPDAIKFHFDNTVEAGTVAIADNDSCREVFQETCLEVLQDFGTAVNEYKFSYESLTAAETEAQLIELSSQWNEFLRDSRAQTLLDIVLTTALERGHFKKGYLVGPPRRQWALLRPNLVYEHASGAPSGDRDKLTVAIEWIGVNWWGDHSPVFGIPFGISLASTYADRPDFQSTGHGLMLHFDNKYSLGWANRSGENSFYLSLDFLKLIEQKDKQLERYKNKLKQF